LNYRNAKQILKAAAQLPPAQARRVVTALQAKADSKPDQEQYLIDAENAMTAAMEAAVLTTLEATLEAMPL
jgi:hypothetical protein